MMFKLLNIICPYNIVSILGRIKRHFYSKWIQYEFHSCGRNCGFGGFSFLHGTKFIDLGSHLYIGKRIVWEVYDDFYGQKFTPLLSFGDGSSFGDDGHITCINKIQIGNGVRIGRKVFITDNAHGASKRALLDIPANLRPLISKGPVIIEDNVWIGEMACIMPGVTIGRGAIIGANAVVTHDIPPYTLVAGNPAHVVKQLN
jgi:acetyltransferase-like isoleucine patch superfamily enzyme